MCPRFRFAAFPSSFWRVGLSRSAAVAARTAAKVPAVGGRFFNVLKNQPMIAGFNVLKPEMDPEQNFSV
jgi:hypothetical protein